MPRSTLYAFLLILLSLSHYSTLKPSAATPKIDIIGHVSYVHDGDTFDINLGKTEIRLADIDAPEIGELNYMESKQYLFNLVYDKTVNLDHSTLNGYSGDRLVCVAYIDYDSENYLNVNKKMLDAGLAILWPHDNDFNPDTWTLLVSKNHQRVVPSYPIESIAIVTLIFLAYLFIKVRKGFHNLIQTSH